MSSFYLDWIASAEAGEPVWLGDVREKAAREPGAARLVLRLTDCGGEQDDFPLCLPRWEGERELALARSMLCAEVFNLLAARGGRELRVFYDRADRSVGALIEELDGLFQLDRRPRSGLGKAVSVSERIAAALGGGRFFIAASDLSVYTPPETKTHRKNASPLGEKLKRIAARAEKGFCCGMDVGGTDVKLAVSLDGRLVSTREYDWDPARSPDAAGIIEPLLALAEEARVCGNGRGFDAIGLSFPDVVIRDRILGGETPKTSGIRNNPALDYETEFAALGRLNEKLQALCAPGGRVHVTNDGNMAAFTAAVELACGDRGELGQGVLAHSLGTDLGSGWLLPDGHVPALPLEMYDFLVDLGSFPQRRYEPADLRSVCNENSGLPGARRYLGQAACFRMAMELEPSLLDGFTEEKNGLLEIPSELRKPCLEHLMAEAERGHAGAEEIFRRIGRHLAQVNREMQRILRPETAERFLYGRFVKRARCFALIREGCASILPELSLIAADESLACSPLMRALARREGVTVAQFGQAVGAICYAWTEDEA